MPAMTTPARSTAGALVFAAAGAALTHVAPAQSCDIDMIFPGVASDLAPIGFLLEVETHDLDGDGDLDVVAPNSTIGAMIYLNDGAGNLTPQPAAPGGLTGAAGALYPEVGDFDGDGVPDLALGRFVSPTGEIVVYRGLGDGSFDPVPIATISEGNPALFEAADIDLDGDIDFVSRGSGGNFLVHRNAGGLTFPDTVVIPVTPSSFLFAQDLNGDDLPDVLMVSSPGTVTILDNLGGGVFAAPRTFDTGSGFVQDALVADLNGDGHPDFAHSRGGSGESLVVRFSDGAGNFEQATTAFQITNIPGGASLGSITAFDLDGDTDTDLIGAYADAAGWGVIVYRNYGAGGFADQSAGLLQPTWIQNVVQAGGADLDGDGSLDLLSINAGGLSITQNQCSSAPVITGQPVSALEQAGASAAFSVDLDAVGATTSFQWRRDGVPLSDDARVSGSGTADLTITGVGAGDEGFYDCVVSTAGGSRTSAQALLAVSGGGSPNECLADVNLDGLLDLSDINAFVDSFTAGCP